MLTPLLRSQCRVRLVTSFSCSRRRDKRSGAHKASNKIEPGCIEEVVQRGWEVGRGCQESLCLSSSVFLSPSVSSSSSQPTESFPVDQMVLAFLAFHQSCMLYCQDDNSERLLQINSSHVNLTIKHKFLNPYIGDLFL